MTDSTVEKDEDTNEITQAAREVQARAQGAESARRMSAMRLAGVGIGSAALAAALIYAGKTRGKRQRD